ncbi:S10 family peptidase [Rivibacter subsaxonicus]|uniref:Carboxypeptidase C (Cathepsin A) n=1 Tax=Rivibacter subsaxonicus TaxID=457575 RepID=A0A4Q7VZG8_9BURK|nr:peptidase S10 [Rivibacter subsaxonicus]RZU02093.1 carboxypeptidase C (cathepsin A) [Rivibacter subsaxonicus]
MRAAARLTLLHRLAAGLLALVLAACGGGSSDGAAPPAQGNWFDATVYSSAPDASLAVAEERAAVTRHTLALPAGTLAYTATTGHLTARDPVSGAALASFFYVAYTLDGASAARRPLTFFYNGGPGSASVWLHLGSYGPRRLATGVPATNLPRPFALVDNTETLLDASDLVFVDAVGTGFSQAIAPNSNRSFWGVDKDAAVFRDFVRRYVQLNDRTASPKLLFGESYGTTRSAVLARLLEQAGIELAGVVLQSSVLDYNSNCAVVEPIVTSCAGYLPSYGATGAWFNLVRPAPAATEPFIASMRTLAADRYDPAVRALMSSGTAPDAGLVAQLVDATGIAQSSWQLRFNQPPEPVRRSLIAGTLLGRYDSRIAAANGSELARDGDPSLTLVDASFATAITSYLGQLGYTNPSRYVMFSNAIESWDFGHDGRPLPDTLPDLAAALTLNPRLQVLAISGHHDLATPFFQTELDLGRLGSLPNVVARAYPGGHMSYLDDASRGRQRADLGAFYRAAQGL